MSISKSTIVQRSDYTSEIMNVIDQLYSKFFPSGNTSIASLITNTKTQVAKTNCSELVPNQTCQILTDMYIDSTNIQAVQGAKDPRTLDFHYEDKIGFNFYDVILKASEMADIKGLAATYLTGTAPCTSDCSTDGCSSDVCKDDTCATDGACTGDIPCDVDEPDCDGFTCATYSYDYPTSGSFHFWCFEFSCSNTFTIYSTDSLGECTIFDLTAGCNGTYEWVTEGSCGLFCG